MTAAGSVHLTAYQSEYEAVLARARQVVASYPSRLREQAESSLPRWGEASFSRIVALLPYWVADLLDETLPLEGNPRCSESDETKTLAVATLLGWWSHLIQDGLLDDEPEQAKGLPLSMALHASAIRLLTQLLPGHVSFWETFERLSLATSEACAWEQQRSIEHLDATGPPSADQSQIAARSSLLQLAVVAQFALRGLDQEHPLRTALAGMLDYYAIARQIGDDRSDWAQDLQKGQLNYVSRCLACHMLASGTVTSFAELDIERMMGFYLCNDELFASIHQEAMEACQHAAGCIAPYGSRSLDALVSDLAQQLERGYQDALENRGALQAAFAFDG